MDYTLEGLTRPFVEWIQRGICPDCGGDLDNNDQCPGWYDEQPNPGSNLSRFLKKLEYPQNTTPSE